MDVAAELEPGEMAERLLDSELTEWRGEQGHTEHMKEYQCTMTVVRGRKMLYIMSRVLELSWPHPWPGSAVDLTLAIMVNFTALMTSSPKLMLPLSSTTTNTPWSPANHEPVPIPPVISTWTRTLTGKELLRHPPAD